MDDSILFPIDFCCDFARLSGDAEFAYRMDPEQLRVFLSELGWASPPKDKAEAVCFSMAVSELFRSLAEGALWEAGLEESTFARTLPLSLRGARGLLQNRAPSPETPISSPDRLSIRLEASSRAFSSEPIPSSKISAALKSLPLAFHSLAPIHSRSQPLPSESLAQGFCIELCQDFPDRDDAFLLAAFSPEAGRRLLSLPGAHSAHSLGAALCMLPELCLRNASFRSWSLAPRPLISNKPNAVQFPRIGIAMAGEGSVPLRTALEGVCRAAGEAPVLSIEWTASSSHSFTESDKAHLAAWESLAMAAPSTNASRPAPRRAL